MRVVIEREMIPAYPSRTIREGPLCCYFVSVSASRAAVRRLREGAHVRVEPAIRDGRGLPGKPGEVDLVFRVPHAAGPGLWVVGQREPVADHRVAGLQDARAAVLRG